MDQCDPFGRFIQPLLSPLSLSLLFSSLSVSLSRGVREVLCKKAPLRSLYIGKRAIFLCPCCGCLTHLPNRTIVYIIFCNLAHSSINFSAHRSRCTVIILVPRVKDYIVLNFFSLDDLMLVAKLNYILQIFINLLALSSILHIKFACFLDGA